MRYHGANTIAHRRYIDSQGVRKQYPAYYGNYQNIPVPADCNVPYLIEWNEFPILRGKVPFVDDSNAGPDRVSTTMLILPMYFLDLSCCRSSSLVGTTISSRTASLCTTKTMQTAKVLEISPSAPSSE